MQHSSIKRVRRVIEDIKGLKLHVEVSMKEKKIFLVTNWQS